MAISLENPNLVWQRAKAFMDSLGSSPEAVQNFQDLKKYLETVKSRPQLQFVAISNLTTVAIAADAACTLYGLYFKKQATATAAYAKSNDSASAAGGGSGANMTDTVKLGASGQEAMLIIPGGRAQANGISNASETTAAGGSNSSSGDGPNGFVILGA